MAECKMWVNMESKGVESKMERKTYKVILNIGYKNESVKYFDRLTKNRIAELENKGAKGTYIKIIDGTLLQLK